MEFADAIGNEEYLLILPRAILGLFLIIAGASKLAVPKDLRSILAAYAVLPANLVPAASLLLPLIELLTGSFLIFMPGSAVGCLVAAGLFLLFAVAIAVNLIRGRRDLPCGCFGRKSYAISWHLAIRNLAMLGIALSMTGRLATVSVLLFTIYGLSLMFRGVGFATRSR